jgi:hypothetical protein
MGSYKQYIVEYAEMPKELQASLQTYDYFCSDLVPYCTVTLRSKEEELSLLEMLATMKGVTYREAVSRKSLEEEK